MQNKNFRRGTGHRAQDKDKEEKKMLQNSLVPYVIEQTAKGERSYDIFSRLLKDRIRRSR